MAPVGRGHAQRTGRGLGTSATPGYLDRVAKDSERTESLWFALLLTLTNGFLDAHTYLVRGGVFANVQTANVIFFAIDMSERRVVAALAHVWPLLAFIAGVALASYIKSGRVEHLVQHPLRWTMGIQAVALAIIGFVPSSVPYSYVTVPISFLAAMQISLFRNVGDLVYLPVATTGNLLRLVESWIRRAGRGKDSVAHGVRGVRRADPCVRGGRPGRCGRQPHPGGPRDLAACRLPGNHALSVHHR